MDKRDLRRIANEVRRRALEEIYLAKSGHPGGTMSAAECFTWLYYEEMKVDPARPDWEDRDRFVLSKGHTAPGLYAVLAMKGFFPLEELKTLRKVGSRLQGHPAMQYLPGLDMSTGSLGQGFSTAVGMAMSAKIRGKDYRIYTLLGDGELEEGIVWEAAMLAGNRKLDNLCAIVDKNKIQLDGFVEDINSPYPIAEKFEAFGFHTIAVEDGNDFDQLAAAFADARATKGKPSVIVMETVKGKGVSFMENNPSWHGKAPSEEDYQKAIEELTKAGEAI